MNLENHQILILTRNRLDQILDLNSLLQGLPLLLLPRHGLCAHDTTTPVPSVLLVFLGVAFVDGADQLAQLALVLALDLGQRQDGRGLLVYNGAQTGLALDDRVGDAHLSAQGWEVNDEFDWVDIVRDEDQGCLFVLNQADDVVEAVFDCVGFL